MKNYGILSKIIFVSAIILMVMLGVHGIIVIRMELSCDFEA